MDKTVKFEVLLAAYYKAADPNLTQEDIGKRAKLGAQPQVARLLAEAKSQGYLREVFQFPADVPLDTRRELLRKLEQSFYKRHKKLEEVLTGRAEDLCDTRSGGGSPFKALHVLPTHDQATFQAFGAGAAEIIAQLIDEADSCCVAWGRSVDITVRHIRSRTKAPNPKKLFMPIAGEPTNYEPNGVSPSDAARILAAAWPESECLSLRGVQARIPKSIYKDDRGGVARQLAMYSNTYRDIFGSKRMIDKVSMILTGIGDVRTSAGEANKQAADPWYLETVEAEERKVLELAVGNIGGVWIARDGASEKEQREVAQVNERWLGAQHDDFRRCSLNAVVGKRPGVVVLAVEPEKAAIVLEALYLVNVLVVSRQLGDALADKLGVPE
jgi:DNA-binding transcriptional regulator LsrR (DeoR family)